MQKQPQSGSRLQLLWSSLVAQIPDEVLVFLEVLIYSSIEVFETSRNSHPSHPNEKF